MNISNININSNDYHYINTVDNKGISSTHRDLIK